MSYRRTPEQLIQIVRKVLKETKDCEGRLGLDELTKAPKQAAAHTPGPIEGHVSSGYVYDRTLECFRDLEGVTMAAGDVCLGLAERDALRSQVKALREDLIFAEEVAHNNYAHLAKAREELAGFAVVAGRLKEQRSQVKALREALEGYVSRINDNHFAKGYVPDDIRRKARAALKVSP